MGRINKVFECPDIWGYVNMSDLGLDMKVLLNIAQGKNTFYTLTVKEKIGSNEGVQNAFGRLVLNNFIEKGPVGSRNSQPYLFITC